MPYNIVGISTGLAVEPTHILQIIDSLQFGSASIDNARAEYCLVSLGSVFNKK